MWSEFKANKEKDKLQETFDACIAICPQGIVAYDYNKEEFLVKNEAFQNVFTADSVIVHWDQPSEEYKEQGEKQSQDTSATILELVKLKDLIKQVQNYDSKDVKLEIDKELWYFTIRSKPIKTQKGTQLLTFIDNTDIIRHANEKAFKKFQRLMLANVTHELKTPLNTINASVDQLQMNKGDAWQTWNLKRIKASTVLMLNLINDIIDNAKFDEGGLDIQTETFLLSELFYEMTELFELQMAGKQNKFEMITDDGINPDCI